MSEKKPKNLSRLRVNGREVLKEQLNENQWRVKASFNGEVVFDHKLNKQKADDAWLYWTTFALVRTMECTVIERD